MCRRTILLAVVMTASLPMLVVGPANAAPRRRGPFAVGARLENLVDSSRPTPASSAAPESPTRTLPTLVLYPAQGKPGADDAAVADLDASGDFVRILGSHAPLAGAGRFPIVVYAHGQGGGQNYLTYALAAAGYVVVAPSFPLSRKDAPGGPSGIDAVNQPGDVKFVLSKMLHLPRRDRDLQRIIDPKAVGVMGASLGGSTMLAVADNSCCRDARIKAAVVIASAEAPIANGEYFGGKPVPILVVHGTADPAAPYQGGQQIFNDAPAPKFFLTLDGAGHIRFGPPWDDVVTRAEIDFFGRYLRHEARGLRDLEKDADVAGVASLQQTPA